MSNSKPRVPTYTAILYTDLTRTGDVKKGHKVKTSVKHISVGTSAETLCGEGEICYATQLDSFEEIEERTDNVCEDCLDKYEYIKEDFEIEPTVECDRCTSEYSASQSRIVQDETGDDVPVCKPCYEELLDSDNSGVTVPYEDADAYYHLTVDEEYNP